MLSNDHKNHTPPETEAGHYFNGQTLQGHRSVFRMMHDAITFDNHDEAQQARMCQETGNPLIQQQQQQQQQCLPP